MADSHICSTTNHVSAYLPTNCIAFTSTKPNRQLARWHVWAAVQGAKKLPEWQNYKTASNSHTLNKYLYTQNTTELLTMFKLHLILHSHVVMVHDPFLTKSAKWVVNNIICVWAGGTLIDVVLALKYRQCVIVQTEGCLENDFASSLMDTEKWQYTQHSHLDVSGSRSWPTSYESPLTLLFPHSR